MFSPRFRKGSRPRSGRGQPFVGYAEMWKAWVSQATCYGEYGVGDSTIWAGRFTQSPIVAVDTSLQWIQYVRDGVGERPEVALNHVDLGPLTSFGRPTSYSRRECFDLYRYSIWQKSPRPDVVLVDGRFRVACLMASLRQIEVGAAVIFDDYLDREIYHVVEEVIRPKYTCGDQALFIRDEAFDSDAARAMELDFRHVMD